MNVIQMRKNTNARSACQVPTQKNFETLFGRPRVEVADMVAPGGKTVRPLDDRSSHFLRNALQHPPENPLMEGIEDVPVKEP